MIKKTSNLNTIISHNMRKTGNI